MDMPISQAAHRSTLRAAVGSLVARPVLGARDEVLVAAPASADTRGLLERLSAAGHPVRQVFDGAEAVAALIAPDAPSIALIDEALPGLSGAEVIRQVRDRGDERYVYAVLMVAQPGRVAKLQGREAGADDCLAKPVNTRELQAYLHAGQRIASLERRLAEARDRFRAQARRDPLTGLANRLEIMETLAREVSRAAREASHVAVIMVDLDHFKRINDTHGHQTGDEVLAEAARRMRDAVRDYDTVGRYGGEEFIVVLPHVDERTAREIAERLRAKLEAHPVATRVGPVPVTASVGVASTHAGALPPEELVGQADAALYEAKDQGRNRVVTAPGFAGLVARAARPDAVQSALG